MDLFPSLTMDKRFYSMFEIKYHFSQKKFLIRHNIAKWLYYILNNKREYRKLEIQTSCVRIVL